MRSFQKKTATRTVTLSNGEEALEFTVRRPALMYMDALNRAFPRLDEDGPAADYRASLRSVLIAAEGIRHSEQLPAAPEFEAGEAAWQAHAEQLFALFDEAGFTKSHLADLYIACLELTAERHDEAVKEAMKEAGND